MTYYEYKSHGYLQWMTSPPQFDVKSPTTILGMSSTQGQWPLLACNLWANTSLTLQHTMEKMILERGRHDT